MIGVALLVSTDRKCRCARKANAFGDAVAVVFAVSDALGKAAKVDETDDTLCHVFVPGTLRSREPYELLELTS